MPSYYATSSTDRGYAAMHHPVLSSGTDVGYAGTSSRTSERTDRAGSAYNGPGSVPLSSYALAPRSPVLTTPELYWLWLCVLHDLWYKFRY
eukprot:3903577-Rhodomonas_salina.1